VAPRLEEEVSLRVPAVQLRLRGTFADDLDGLVACRQTELGWPCPNRWLTLESRHPWEHAYRVSEDDEQAFSASAAPSSGTASPSST
jgi:hypothetical protein